jgi:hypothetical protein
VCAQRIHRCQDVLVVCRKAGCKILLSVRGIRLTIAIHLSCHMTVDVVQFSCDVILAFSSRGRWRFHQCGVIELANQRHLSVQALQFGSGAGARAFIRGVGQGKSGQV